MSFDPVEVGRVGGGASEEGCRELADERGGERRELPAPKEEADHQEGVGEEKDGRWWGDSGGRGLV
jgi:hypothetical protein